MESIIILDTETTGVGTNDQVVELALTDRDGRILYESLFKPDVPMNQEASEVNGIRDADLARAPRFIDEWPKIRKMLEGHAVAGHNVLSFDLRLIRQTLEAQGMDASEMGRAFGTVIDTLALARKLGFARASQKALAEAYGIEGGQDHRAASDCRLLAKIMDRMERGFFERVLHESASHPFGAPVPRREPAKATVPIERVPPCGMTPRRCLELVEDGATFGDLAKESGHSAQAVAGLLGSLFAEGLISLDKAIWLMRGHAGAPAEEHGAWKNGVITMARIFADEDACATESGRYMKARTSADEEMRFAVGFAAAAWRKIADEAGQAPCPGM